MKVKYMVLNCFFYLLRVFPINSHKIVVDNFSGKGYGDHCKYIIEELIKKSKDRKIDIVWLTEKKTDAFPSEIRCVTPSSFQALYEQVTAKVWIDNLRKPEYVRKRKNQFYVMTWHGGIALKKIEKDVENNLPRSYIRAAKNDSDMADLLIAGSEWEYNLIRNSFWYNGEIAKCGLPRMDILYKNDPELKLNLKRKLGIPDDVKCVLYAPTFRATLVNMDVSVYKLDWARIINALESKTKDKWSGLMRLHPNIMPLAEKLNLPKTVLNVTSYPDMQELLLVADCLITDYSTTIFEYSIKGKMAFIFALDLDEYMKDRSLYFDFSELPYSLSQSNDELLKNIQNFNQDKYNEKIKEFFVEKCGCYAGGNASSYIAGRILENLD